MMKKPLIKYIVVLSACCLLLLSISVKALTPQQIPNPRHQNINTWVTDIAGVLSEETKTTINQKISTLEAKNGTEIAVVTIAKVSGNITVKQFTTNLFNYWGIGKKNQNNGVLFLTSTGDRRVEIEIGKGLKNILTPAVIQNILTSQIVPQFKEDNFDRGILNGVNALVATLESSNFDNPNNLSSNFIDKKYKFPIFSLAITFVFIVISCYFLYKEKLRLSTPIAISLATRERLPLKEKYPKSFLLKFFTFLTTFFLLLLPSLIITPFLLTSDNSISFFPLALFTALAFFLNYYLLKANNYIPSVEAGIYQGGQDILLYFSVLFILGLLSGLLESQSIIAVGLSIAIINLYPIFRIFYRLILTPHHLRTFLMVFANLIICFVINIVYVSIVSLTLPHFFLITLVNLIIFYSFANGICKENLFNYQTDINLFSKVILILFSPIWLIILPLLSTLDFIYNQQIQRIFYGISQSSLWLSNNLLSQMPWMVFLGLFLSLLSFPLIFPIIAHHFPLEKDKFKPKRKAYSIESQQPLETLSNVELDDVLTPQEKVAQKIGSVEFEVWKKALDYHYQREDLGFRIYEINSQDFDFCPICEELTLTQKVTVKKSSISRFFKIKSTNYDCQCCNYSHKTEEEIYIPQPQERESFFYNNNDNNDSNYDSYDGNSGGDSGGDFGGGSSDGDGGGDDF